MFIIKEIDSLEFEKGLEKLPLEKRSFLQSTEYGELYKKLGDQPLYLGIYKSSSNQKNSEKLELIQSLILILIKAKRGTYLLCSYGFHDQAQLEALMPFLKNYGKKHQVDFLRFSPLLDDNAENQQLFHKFGFKDAPVHMTHPELLWLLDIDKKDEEILAGMRKNTRYYIKRAEKDGVTVVSGNGQEMLDQFYAIHEETARRQKFVPYSKKFLDAELAVFAPKDQIRVFLGIYQDKPIAGSVIVYYGNEGVYHHAASLSEYNKIPAPYLIQWEAIQEAKRRNLKVYNFFGVVLNKPNHPWAGLTFFKQGFGGSGRAVLHCQDYPLSWKYHLNWLIETIRRIKRRY